MTTNSPPPWNPAEAPAPTAESGVGAASPQHQLPAWHPSLKPPPPPPRQDPLTGKFVKGQVGRPVGSRNKVSLAAELILIDEFERITRKCVEMALAGDPTALRICFDRLYPPRKGRILPKLQRKDGEGSVEALLRAVLDGEITPVEGTEVVNLIESAARVAATQALGEVRQHQLEVFKRAQERGQLGSGVMMVPFFEDEESWEAVSCSTQRELKARVKG